MKKITFILLLIIMLGFIGYYYAEKNNIEIISKNSISTINNNIKNSISASRLHPESKDIYIKTIEPNTPKKENSI